MEDDDEELDDDYEGYEEGDVVQFQLEGAEARGRIEYVMTEGYFSLPDSIFYTEATRENPALLIRIWEGDTETEYMVGRLASEVS